MNAGRFLAQRDTWPRPQTPAGTDTLSR